MIFIVILVVIFLYPLLFSPRENSTNIQSIYIKNTVQPVPNVKIYYFIVSAVMIGIVGLRDVTIGIDTQMYQQIFNRYMNMSFVDAIKSKHTEYGYSIFQWLIGNVFGQFQVFLFICAVFYIIIIAVLIYNYSKVPWMSFFLFVTFGFMSFGMSTMRQTLAVCFTIVAFSFIKRKKLFWYLLFLALAVSFHQTAFIFFPAYWFGKFKLNKKFLSIAVLAVILVIVLKDKLLSIAQSYARIQYQTTEDAGGWIMYLFVGLSVVLGIAYKYQLIEDSEDNRLFFYMIVAELVIFPIAKTSPVLFRMYYYYSIYLIIYIPNLLHCIKDKVAKIIGYTCYLAAGVSQFMLIFNPTLQIIPYKFFWS